MTDENGATVYGTCVVFYERLADRLKEPVDKAIGEWVKSNMPLSTVEYAQHLQGKINQEKMELEKAKKNDEQMMRNQVEERIRTCQENIELYKELLEPVKMGVCKAEDVWVPKSIGLLGRMPWINLYGDWIRILLDNIVGVGGHRNTKPTIDIESTIINLIEEVPLPPPGRFEIGLTINRKPLFFSRPPINQVPILKNVNKSDALFKQIIIINSIFILQFSLYPVFRALSPHLILAVLEVSIFNFSLKFIIN